MSRLDVELDTPADRNAAPGARALGVAGRVACDPGGERPPRFPARRGALALERQLIRHRQRSAQGLSRPPLQHVARLVLHVLGDRREGRTLHLPQLDPQQLEEVTIGVGGGRAPSLVRAHQAFGHVEADGALARQGARGGVDRGDRRGVQDRPRQLRKVAEIPGREVAVFPQDVHRFVVWGPRHASAPPRPRSSASRNTAVSQSVTWCKLNGLRITVQWCRSSQLRTSSASASPVMIAMRPSSAGQRWMIARYSASPDMVGRWMSRSRASGCAVLSSWYAVSALPAEITRWPARVSERSSTRRSGASSSTTRIVYGGPLMRPRPARRRASGTAAPRGPARPPG